MSDTILFLVSTSSAILAPALGLLGGIATLFAVAVSLMRGHGRTAVFFGLALVAFTPGLLLAGPIGPEIETVATWLQGPAPACGPEMCGTACMYSYESWLEPARTLLWTSHILGDALGYLLLAVGVTGIRSGR